MAPDDASADNTQPVVNTVRDPHRPTTAPTDSVELPQPLAAYQLGPVLGRGGSGEVIAAHDQRVGRPVALKRLKSDDPSDDEIARFVREARIQARLDHPAVVPVHDLGHDEAGRPYFTMKQLSGVTLAQRLAERDVVLQPLLRVFADVCHAIDLAHSRGIIHRDLKPANIMLGDFGAVYVLDWGLARELADAADTLAPPARSGPDTHSGVLLGTPGYMAPEQVEEAARVQRPADVFSLGAILFEILAREPLYPRGAAALAATLLDSDPHPGHRTPERMIPPELDALCATMLAREPNSRPTAHQVALQIEAFLDGDRDVTARRALAREDLARARVAFGAGARADAMRAAGRALALDPESRDAAELVSRLMLEPPPTPPPGLHAAIRTSEAELIRRHAHSSLRAFVGLLCFIPVAVWNGVRSWPLLIAFTSLAIVLGAGAYVMTRLPRRGFADLLGYFACSGVLLALLGMMVGPFMFVPALACVVTMSALMYPPLARRPAVVVAITLAGWLLPMVLERTGVLAATWSIVDGTIQTTSHVLQIGGLPTTVFLFGASLATIVLAALHAAALSRSHLEAHDKLVSQAWHLQLLLPDPA